MSTLARPATRIAANSNPPVGLRFALADWADTLAAGVSAAISRELKSRAASAATVRNTVKKLMPALLEDAFLRNLIETERDAPKRRAVLIHLLSAADAGIIPATHGADAKPADQAVLTSEEAAVMLHVSRTHLNTLLDAGKLGPVERTAGGHRRIPRPAVIAYKEACKARQARGLDTMVSASRRLGLYEGELKGVPRRSKR